MPRPPSVLVRGLFMSWYTLLPYHGPTAPQGQSTVLDRKAARTKGCEVNLNTHGAMYGEGTNSVRMGTWYLRGMSEKKRKKFWFSIPPSEPLSWGVLPKKIPRRLSFSCFFLFSRLEHSTCSMITILLIAPILLYVAYRGHTFCLFRMGDCTFFS